MDLQTTLKFNSDETKVSICFVNGKKSKEYRSKLDFSIDVVKYVNLGMLTKDEGEKLIYRVGYKPTMAWSSDTPSLVHTAFSYFQQYLKQ